MNLNIKIEIVNSVYTNIQYEKHATASKLRKIEQHTTYTCTTYKTHRTLLATSSCTYWSARLLTCLYWHNVLYITLQVHKPVLYITPHIHISHIHISLPGGYVSAHKTTRSQHAYSLFNVSANTASILREYISMHSCISSPHRSSKLK